MASPLRDRLIPEAGESTAADRVRGGLGVDGSVPVTTSDDVPDLVECLPRHSAGERVREVWRTPGALVVFGCLACSRLARQAPANSGHRGDVDDRRSELPLACGDSGVGLSSGGRGGCIRWLRYAMRRYFGVSGTTMQNVAAVLQLIWIAVGLQFNLYNIVTVLKTNGNCALGRYQNGTLVADSVLQNSRFWVSEAGYSLSQAGCGFRIVCWVVINCSIVVMALSATALFQSGYLQSVAEDTAQYLSRAPELGEDGRPVFVAEGGQLLSQAEIGQHPKFSRAPKPLQAPWMAISSVELTVASHRSLKWSPALAEQHFVMASVHMQLLGIGMVTIGVVQWMLTGDQANGRWERDASTAFSLLHHVTGCIWGQGVLLGIPALLVHHSRLLVLQIKSVQAIVACAKNETQVVKAIVALQARIQKASRTWNAAAGASIIGAATFVFSSIVVTLNYGTVRQWNSVPNELWLLSIVFLTCQSYVRVNGALVVLFRSITKRLLLSPSARAHVRGDIDALRVSWRLLGVVVDQKLLAGMAVSLVLAKVRALF